MRSRAMFSVAMVMFATAAWTARPGAAQTTLTEGEPQLVTAAATLAHEGPSWDPKTGWVYFVGRNKVSRVNLEGKVETVLDPSPGANGALVDPQGRVIVCEGGANPRVIRIEKDKSVTVLADNFEGHKFNSPNDAALDSKGRVYFTDPRYGSRTTMEIKDASGKLIEGVYRVDAPGKVTRILGTEVDRPNGLLIAPGDKYLYIADNNNDAGGTRKLIRFDMRKDGTVAPETKTVIFDWHTARGPDGMKLDSKGNFWVAAARNNPSRTETVEEFKGGIFIISPQGKLLQFLGFPKDETTNVGFAGPDLKTVYITSGESLYTIRSKVAGLISAK
jgi:gluconolactonase